MVSALVFAVLYMQLHRVELEMDQLQHTLQLCQQRHNEEIESIEKSHRYIGTYLMLHKGVARFIKVRGLRKIVS